MVENASVLVGTPQCPNKLGPNRKERETQSERADDGSACIVNILIVAACCYTIVGVVYAIMFS
jgi:hypothetical protein